MYEHNYNVIKEWLFQVYKALENRNGGILALLLSSKCDKLSRKNLYGFQEEVAQNLCRGSFAIFDKQLTSGFDQFFSDFVKLKVAIANFRSNMDDILKRAFRLVEFVSVFITILSLWLDIYLDDNLFDHHWLVPALYSLCNFTRTIGLVADRCSSLSMDYLDNEFETDKDKYMKQVLNNVRSKMGRVRGDESRHSAYIVLLAQSIKGCMQLGNMQMAAGFLKAIESTNINYKRALRVPLINYRFYLGKLHMQYNEFLEAEEHLAWAFSNCLKDNIKARREILECLIVVRLQLGKVPPFPLMEKYNLPHYAQIVRYIITGDVSRYTDTVLKFFYEFVKEGTVLCVELLKYLAYRTLIRKTKTWWNTNVPSAKNNMLPVGVLTAAEKSQIPTTSNLHMLCTCSNLIVRGYIKGYVSWEKETIVFSTVQPFPKISTCSFN